MPSTGVPGPGRRARVPGSTWAGRRRGAAAGGDPATSQHSEQPALAGRGLHGPRPPPRPASRSPPPLQGAPRSSRLRGAVAALSGRAPLGSSPRALALFRPPPGSSERCATAGEDSRPQADCPLPPRPGHLPLMPAGRPRPGTAPSRPLPPCPELGRPTARSPGPRPPPCGPGLSASAPRPRPERAAEERRPIVDREVMRAGSMLIRPPREPGRETWPQVLLEFSAVVHQDGTHFPEGSAL